MIAYVADTHAVLWYVFGDARMSERARVAIHDEAAEGHKTALSAWTISEIVYQLDRPEFEFPTAFDRVIAGLADPLFEIVEVPVTSSIAGRMRDIPRNMLTDPADRIIAATAMTLEVPLITHDRKIKEFAMTEPNKLQTLW